MQIAKDSGKYILNQRAKIHWNTVNIWFNALIFVPYIFGFTFGRTKSDLKTYNWFLACLRILIIIDFARRIDSNMKLGLRSVLQSNVVQFSFMWTFSNMNHFILNSPLTKINFTYKNLISGILSWFRKFDNFDYFCIMFFVVRFRIGSSLSG
jgi:hypothetical protein